MNCIVHGVAKSGARVKQLSTHANETSRIVEFLESESALVDARGQRWGVEMECLVGTESQDVVV